MRQQRSEISRFLRAPETRRPIIRRKAENVVLLDAFDLEAMREAHAITARNQLTPRRQRRYEERA